MAKRVDFTSESALIIEAQLAIVLMRVILGFETTVLATLGVLTGHIIKLSL